ncbi:hypothetical protein BDB00DRAFT_815531 [Zychaea mexicana]|uniref:uncharacterized protein n=1 Tax=Zychaea mexicana TaxID=64656 RepID=UPI0022FF1915|nr:uncharacterized protein BDB00DRAFT_815531 [Zychaea mexicana]KAI9495022.1 hypothetical protein BDB00DRAFT_815531 [Zychaea mexicana]
MALSDETRAPLLSRNRIDESADNRSERSNEEITDYGSSSGVYRYPLYLQPGQFTSLEKLMFFISSILLIFLCVFIGLYARSSFDDRLQPPVPSPSPTPSDPPVVQPPPDKNESYCLQSNCILTAAKILQDVNPNIDPCSDFYAYTCSNWMEEHALREDKPKTSVETRVDEKIKNQLNQILMHSFDDANPLDNNGDGSSLPAPDRILDTQLFTKLQDFYETCMDEDTIDQYKVEPLYDMFRSIRHYIPLGYYVSAPVDGLSQAISYLATNDIWALFKINMGPDPENPHMSTLSVSQGELGLPSREYYDDPDIVAAYMQMVTEMLELVFKQDTHNEFGWKQWSTVATARRIVEFEKELALQSLHDDHHHAQEEPQHYYWTITELQQTAPYLNWTTVFDTVGASHAKQVWIPRPELITGGLQVLKASNSRTLQMYLVWRSLWRYLDTLGDMFVAPRRKLDAKLSGVEARAKPPRWQFCLSQVDRSLGFLLGRYFVLRDKDATETTARAEAMVEQLTETVAGRLGRVPWLVSEQDRNAALDKIQQLDRQVSCPTVAPDTRSPIALAEFYQDVVPDRESFFKSVQSASQWKVKHSWDRLHQPIDRSSWDLVPQHVGMAYNRALNKVQIPAAMLQPPFFDPNGPDYLNYGALGAMIVHEIMHGFDRGGRHYDAQGKHGTDWWSSESQAAFDTAASCLERQYAGFNVSGPNHQTYPVDGTQTLDGNIADLGGLLQAYATWKKSRQVKDSNDRLLPGLDDWSRDQLFYINYARMRCSKSTLENKLQELHTSHHAPDRWRVNGPLMNSEHFAKTFSCPIGTPMNPPDKCKVW